MTHDSVPLWHHWPWEWYCHLYLLSACEFVNQEMCNQGTSWHPGGHAELRDHAMVAPCPAKSFQASFPFFLELWDKIWNRKPWGYADNSETHCIVAYTGALIYLLNLFCNSQNPSVREETAALFAKMITDKLVGPKVRIVLAKFLPLVFMDAMRDSAEASVHMFESKPL